MIPRALNAPLSWIGLMRVSEHEAEASVLNSDVATAKRHWDEVRTQRDQLSAAFPADVRAVIDVMTDYRADSAEQIAADASFESGLSILPARVSAIRKALHTLDLAEYGTLHDEDSTHIAGRGYWLTKTGRSLQLLWRAARLKRRGNK